MHKTQYTNAKQNPKPKTQVGNPYRELESRTTRFATQVIALCQTIPKNSINNPIVSQLIRASGSIGANYREANEAIGKKDLSYRLRISRKEAKESVHWLALLRQANPGLQHQVATLTGEADQLRNIFTAILNKVQ